MELATVDEPLHLGLTASVVSVIFGFEYQKARFPAWKASARPFLSAYLLEPCFFSSFGSLFGPWEKGVAGVWICNSIQPVFPFT